MSDALAFYWPRTLDPAAGDLAAIELVRAEAARLRKQSDRHLRQQSAEARLKVQSGARLVDRAVIIPAFALILEATRRVLGIEQYDVQLLAGLAVSRPAVAEMQTGEGKTLAAMFPAFLHALSGRGVHIMTVNDYLAERDWAFLAPVYRLLGLSAGLVRTGGSPAEKAAAYACDITYGPGYEFGFDYLRYQAALLAQRKQRLGESFLQRLQGQAPTLPLFLQRGHAVAVVDEIDSVLLDEATTPLILTNVEPAIGDDGLVHRAAATASQQLIRDRDYVVDERLQQLHLTLIGQRRATQMLPAAVRPRLRRRWLTYVVQSLQANLLLRRDVDYIVDDDKICLVDSYTGRVFSDRSWRDGLQQAVEVKENVTITPDSLPLARITRQRYFRLYDTVCGMSGTVCGSEREFRDVYGLNIVVIPPRKPCLRKTLPLRCFASRAAKLNAIVEEIVRVYHTRQPILIGTTTIESSEILADRLRSVLLPFRLLNGKQDAEEASIVARAGELGAITIATNMAGRGTDIKLSGGVAELGGLHVIATEPQESTRVDRQLIGRAARQGDPGSCQMFASAEDRLICRFAPSLMRRLQRVADATGRITEDLLQEIARVQRKVERLRCAQRRRMFDHDDWLESVLRDLA